MEKFTSSEQGEIAAAVAAFAEAKTVTVDPIERLTGELAAAKGENVQLRQAVARWRDPDRVAAWAAALEEDARGILDWALAAEERLAQIATSAGILDDHAAWRLGRIYELARSMRAPHFPITRLEDVREEDSDDAAAEDD